MKRRAFLKLVAGAGIAALVPVHFLLDNEDNETRFLKYAVETYDDEVLISALLIEYLNHSTWNSSESPSKFVLDFVNRQPEVVTWLRERVRANKQRYWTYSEACRRSIRENTAEPVQRKRAREEYLHLARKFGLSIAERPKSAFSAS